ncbi:hypothetical protein BV898_03994 [Hypsibius exemplaris]|uniref:Uncharacterized protein n=1 Tax=Hypsibius exemplaris TaxID=2072580 RepID=A0A1W0X3L8_HYPEX|nr:hypothetical protein BV898_03994 [Hypsibius exemplaris]
MKETRLYWKILFREAGTCRSDILPSGISRSRFLLGLVDCTCTAVTLNWQAAIPITFCVDLILIHLGSRCCVDHGCVPNC